MLLRVDTEAQLSEYVEKRNAEFDIKLNDLETNGIDFGRFERFLSDETKDRIEDRAIDFVEWNHNSFTSWSNQSFGYLFETTASLNDDLRDLSNMLKSVEICTVEPAPSPGPVAPLAAEPVYLL